MLLFVKIFKKPPCKKRTKKKAWKLNSNNLKKNEIYQRLKIVKITEMLPNLLDTQLFVVQVVELLIDEDHMKVFVLTDWLVVYHGIEQVNFHFGSPHNCHSIYDF